MFFWFLNYDIEDIIKTSLIGVVVMIISTIMFHYMWLNRSEFKIPTTFHENTYKFSENSGFYTKMKTLVFDLSNHNYWVSNIGNYLQFSQITNRIRVLLLPSLHIHDHESFNHISHDICIWKFDFLRDAEDHEFRILGK